MATTDAAGRIGWRTPDFVVGCGCLIALLSFGPRSALGQFLTPLSLSGNWGRDVFSFAVAIQNLLWGLGQPFAGGVADRFGATRVLCTGALLYALGLVLMAYSTTPAMLHLSAGVLIGFGLSGCSFNLVIGALGKLVPDDWRSSCRCRWRWRHPPRRPGRRLRASRSCRPCPRRSVIAVTCCSCSASSPAGSSWPSSPCIFRPIWWTAAYRPASVRGPSP